MKGAELVKLGYSTIEKIRQALACRKLLLEKNALVGVQYYEDFQEKMSRDEAQQIGTYVYHCLRSEDFFIRLLIKVNLNYKGQIISNACWEQYPDAEVSIMGSFRRGNDSCGDVDILIVHEKFNFTTPPGAIDELVECLRRRGHISDHLTHVNKKNYNIDRSSHLPKSQMYMGVFISPITKGKKRRIDIKFYPYRERAFATLYFTGNAHFNRSMRLWANKQRRMILDDHGLYKQDNFGKVIKHERVEAKSEKVVFDVLNLVYREPRQRDSFDAVIEKGSSKLEFIENSKKLYS